MCRSSPSFPALQPVLLSGARFAIIGGNLGSVWPKQKARKVSIWREDKHSDWLRSKCFERQGKSVADALAVAREVGAVLARVQAG